MVLLQGALLGVADVVWLLGVADVVWLLGVADVVWLLGWLMWLAVRCG